MGSPQLRLDRHDGLKIAKGAAIAASGAVLAYLAGTAIPQLEDSGALSASAAAFLAVLVNAARKYLTDTRGDVVPWNSGTA